MSSPARPRYYERLVSRLIMTIKPSIAPTLQALLFPLWADSGTISLNTTHIMAPRITSGSYILKSTWDLGFTDQWGSGTV